jgi:dolichol-phosphate mannosyltransferase
VAEFLITRNIDAVGYVFQVETTYLAHQQGFSIKEIPITFTERRAGQSKFNFPIIWESFWKVLKLRYRKWQK